MKMALHLWNFGDEWKVNLANQSMTFEWKEGFTGIAYFCPVCGSLWARADPLLEMERKYYAYHVPCPKHPWPEHPYLPLPGDLFLPFENEYNDMIAPIAIELLNQLWAKSNEPTLANDNSTVHNGFVLTPNPAPRAEDPSSWWDWNGKDAQPENVP